MAYLEHFSLNTPKLLVLYLGGSFEGCKIEMHDVAFVVAQNDTEASAKIKKLWRGTEKSLHVDSWFVAQEVDGYEVDVSRTKARDTDCALYFVNLGYYIQGTFGESHFVTLTVARSKVEAIENAKKKCSQELKMLHNDNVYDLDDCIRIDEVDGFHIKLTYKTLDAKTIMPINGYQKLRPEAPLLV